MPRLPGDDEDLKVGDVLYPEEYTTEEEHPPRLAKAEHGYVLKLHTVRSRWILHLKHRRINLILVVRTLCLFTLGGGLVGAIMAAYIMYRMM